MMYWCQFTNVHNKLIVPIPSPTEHWLLMVNWYVSMTYSVYWWSLGKYWRSEWMIIDGELLIVYDGDWPVIHAWFIDRKFGTVSMTINDRQRLKIYKSLARERCSFSTELLWSSGWLPFWAISCAALATSYLFNFQAPGSAAGRWWTPTKRFTMKLNKLEKLSDCRCVTRPKLPRSSKIFQALVCCLEMAQLFL